MYWGRRSEMTWIPLNVDLGDFLQIVGITIVIPSWVTVAIPVSAEAVIMGFPGCFTKFFCSFPVIKTFIQLSSLFLSSIPPNFG